MCSFDSGYEECLVILGWATTGVLSQCENNIYLKKRISSRGMRLDLNTRDGAWFHGGKFGKLKVGEKRQLGDLTKFN